MVHTITVSDEEFAEIVAALGRISEGNDNGFPLFSRLFEQLKNSSTFGYARHLELYDSLRFSSVGS